MQKKLFAFIKNCQRALDASPSIAPCFFHGLCVVEALQDSLNEALQSTRSYSQDTCVLHVSLSEKHACKAAYLTYANEAIQREGDHELSLLWSLAARNLDEEIQLKLRNLEQPTQMTKKFLQRAEAEETNIAQHQHEWSAQCLYLHLRALHHHRCAAAMWALERHHSHDFAADICEEAAEARALCDQTTHPSELALLEKADSHWQAAMALVEVHAGNRLDVQSQDFLRIQDRANKARHLVRCLPHVRKLATALDNVRVDLASTAVIENSCRDATMLRV